MLSDRRRRRDRCALGDADRGARDRVGIVRQALEHQPFPSRTVDSRVVPGARPSTSPYTAWLAGSSRYTSAAREGLCRWRTTSAGPAGGSCQPRPQPLATPPRRCAGGASAVTCAWLDTAPSSQHPHQDEHGAGGRRPTDAAASVEAGRDQASGPPVYVERDHLMLGGGLARTAIPKGLVAKSSLPVHRTASGSDAWPAHRVSATEGRLAASDRRSRRDHPPPNELRLRAPDARETIEARPGGPRQALVARRPGRAALVRRAALPGAVGTSRWCMPRRAESGRGGVGERHRAVGVGVREAAGRRATTFAHPCVEGERNTRSARSRGRHQRVHRDPPHLPYLIRLRRYWACDRPSDRRSKTATTTTVDQAVEPTARCRRVRSSPSVIAEQARCAAEAGDAVVRGSEGPRERVRRSPPCRCLTMA